MLSNLPRTLVTLGTLCALRSLQCNESDLISAFWQRMLLVLMCFALLHTCLNALPLTLEAIYSMQQVIEQLAA